MSDEFPQSYTAPQPLAVKETYSRIRGSSSQSTALNAQAIQSTSNRANPDYFAHLGTHFELKNNSRPGMVFEDAPRTKKLHNELQEDLGFLYQMREIWEAKLAQLQMDYDMLRDMSLNRPEEARMIKRQQPEQGHQYQQHQAPTIFNPSEDKQESVTAVDPVHQQCPTAIATPTQPPEQKSRSATKESPTALLEDLEEFFPLDTDEEDDLGTGAGGDDDERARQALTLLLAQYGDEF